MADKFLNFYMDESGPRRPDRKPAVFEKARNDFFGYGGILASDSEELASRAAYAAFCNRWGISYPLHSVEIRNKQGNFSWLAIDAGKTEAFMADLTAFLVGLPVVGLACVIDRPGYDARYRVQYGRQQWRLCKTAFTIAVERAAKVAVTKSLLLRVYPERCSKDDDQRVESYFVGLKTTGSPFDAGTSGKYKPMDKADCRRLLSEIKFKAKSSPMVQIADLYLWPMCKAGYQPGHRPYVALKDAKRIIDCTLDASEIAERGIKYSCFELVQAP